MHVDRLLLILVRTSRFEQIVTFASPLIQS
jgi:hypothetical protein